MCIQVSNFFLGHSRLPLWFFSYIKLLLKLLLIAIQMFFSIKLIYFSALNLFKLLFGLLLTATWIFLSSKIITWVAPNHCSDFFLSWMHLPLNFEYFSLTITCPINSCNAGNYQWSMFWWNYWLICWYCKSILSPIFCPLQVFRYNGVAYQCVCSLLGSPYFL